MRIQLDIANAKALAKSVRNTIQTAHPLKHTASQALTAATLGQSSWSALHAQLPGAFSVHPEAFIQWLSDHSKPIDFPHTYLEAALLNAAIPSTCIRPGHLAAAFFLAEINNEVHGGVSPSTLDSAIDSLEQMPADVLETLNPEMEEAIKQESVSKRDAAYAQLENELYVLRRLLGGGVLLDNLLKKDAFSDNDSLFHLHGNIEGQKITCPASPYDVDWLNICGNHIEVKGRSGESIIEAIRNTPCLLDVNDTTYIGPAREEDWFAPLNRSELRTHYYGPEKMFEMDTGVQMRVGTDYIRVVENQVEVFYWHVDKLTEAPSVVTTALMDSLNQMYNTH